MRILADLTAEERAEIELEENRQRKDLTPAELSQEMVRKAVQVAPVLSSAIDDKKSRGHKRTYAAPKDDVAAALAVSKGTLINAEQHVAAMERYPILGGPEVSQKQALELAKVLDELPAGAEQSKSSKR